METQTKINAGLLAAIVIIYTYVGVSGMEPTHKCESRELTAYCYDMSESLKTCYTLPGTKQVGGKRCTEKWQDYSSIITPEAPSYEQSGEQWICHTEPKGCEKIK